MKSIKHFFKRVLIAENIEDVDTSAQQIVNSVIRLADEGANLEQLQILAESLHTIIRSTDAYAVMKVSIYSLDEYVDILNRQARGEKVNEKYLKELREGLLHARI